MDCYWLSLSGRKKINGIWSFEVNGSFRRSLLTYYKIFHDNLKPNTRLARE
jgi:hypothetical protein